MKNYDFIAIGDIVIDAFIKLKDADIHCDVNQENCQICMRFKDKVPYESVTVVDAVGNSPNAAVAAARLGLDTALVTDLGNDKHGEDCIASLEKERVGIDFVTRHDGQKTNYHYVLWYGSDRTILIKHEEYERKLPNLGTPKWVYLSSLGEDSLSYQESLVDWLETHSEVRVAFQPGTFQIKVGTEKLKRLYERSELFFCNKEEAQRILGNQENDIKKLLAAVQALGPQIPVITDGPKGAYALADNEYWRVPIYPDPKAPLDRTGAGDAFSSTVAVALASGKTLPEALAWGPINSMSVIQYVGAQEGLLSRDQLEKYLAAAPADYRVEKI